MYWARTNGARIALAKNLKKYRKLLGISIRDLAKSTGLSELDLMKTELGQDCINSNDLYSVAGLFEVKCSDLFK